MVFVSKEPELFGGKVKVTILVDGEEAFSNACQPVEADGMERAGLHQIVYHYMKYMLQHAANSFHTDLAYLKQCLSKAKQQGAVCDLAAANLHLLEQHQPHIGSSHAGAYRRKLRQVRELAAHYKAIFQSNTTI